MSGLSPGVPRRGADPVHRSTGDDARVDVVSSLWAQVSATSPPLPLWLLVLTAALAAARSVLVAAGLVRLDPDGAWLVHAAGARYAVRASITEGSPGGQPSLFEEEAP